MTQSPQPPPNQAAPPPEYAPMQQGGLPPPAPGFLRDTQGKPSSMRLMSFIALLAAILFGWMSIAAETGATAVSSKTGLFITCAFLIAAFAPKALQKFIEDYYPRRH